MFGILLTGISSIFFEAADSIGKREFNDKKESFYTFAFLSLFFGAIIFTGYGFFFQNFIFKVASLPTFLLRLVLEILQAHVAALAIVSVDRSMFGFVRMLTLPLLLAVDFWLGYSVVGTQVFGIVLIVCSILILFSFKGVKTKGLLLVLFVSVNAVATISLFKYNISHFNSVSAEQGIVEIVLALYFFCMAMWRAKENPFLFLKKPIFILQATSSGLASVIGSFAYLFAPASIITAASRAFTVLGTIVSGNLFFGEKKFALKLFLFLLIVTGLIFLVL